MYPVSDAYIDKIMSTSIESWGWEGKLTTTSGTVIEFTEKDMISGRSTYAHEIVTGQSIEVGTTCSAELRLGLYSDADRYTLYGATIEISFYLGLNDGAKEYVPLGIFTIESTERIIDGFVVTAYDNMSKFNKVINTYTDKTVYQWLVTACNNCGVVLGNTQEQIAAMPNGNIVTSCFNISGKANTWRSIIGYIAKTVGGFAVIGPDAKLYIKRYTMDKVRTIPASFRYSSSLADFETYYSTLTSVNMRTEADLEVTATKTGGLTYEYGENPMIQFIDDNVAKRILKNILDELSSIEYTPFNVTTPSDPSLQVGDVIEFTDNQAVEGKYGVITHIQYSLVGSMNLQCVGDNPRLQEIQTKKEKSLADATTSFTSSEFRYYDFILENDLTVEDGQQAILIPLTYDCGGKCHVDFHAEICYTIEKTEGAENDPYIVITYFLDGNQVSYHPQTLTGEGKHLMSLLYFWTTQQQIENGNFVVWINVRNGSIELLENETRGYLCGQGLTVVGRDYEFEIPNNLILIYVSQYPTKTSYSVGQELDYTGLVVKGLYSDGTEIDVTSSCTFTPANGATITEEQVGVLFVEVVYTSDGLPYYTNFDLEVLDRILVSIEVTTLPKIEWTQGDILDLTGIVVTGTFDDGSTADVTEYCTFSPASGETLITPGIITDTVTLDELTTTFNLDVADYPFFDLRYVIYTIDDANKLIRVTALNVENIVADDLASLTIPDHYTYNGMEYSIYIS